MTRRAAILTVAFALAATALAGCHPALYAASAPPPGRNGRLDTKTRKVSMSTGVALAVSCEFRGPCRNLKVTSDNPEVVEAVPASLVRLELTMFRGLAPASTFVLVAKAPGRTHVHVATKDGDRSLDVTVAD